MKRECENLPHSCNGQAGTKGRAMTYLGFVVSQRPRRLCPRSLRIQRLALSGRSGSGFACLRSHERLTNQMHRPRIHRVEYYDQ